MRCEYYSDNYGTPYIPHYVFCLFSHLFPSFRDYIAIINKWKNHIQNKVLPWTSDQPPPHVCRNSRFKCFAYIVRIMPYSTSQSDWHTSPPGKVYPSYFVKMLKMRHLNSLVKFAEASSMKFLRLITWFLKKLTKCLKWANWLVCQVWKG